MVHYRFEDYNDIFNILRIKLGLSDKAVMSINDNIDEIDIKYRPDFTIEDRGKKFIVEVQSTVKSESIAMLYLLKELLKRQNIKTSGITFVIACKVIPREQEALAKKVGIELIQLPPGLAFPGREYDIVPGGVKLTPDKSWRIITRLLKEKISSVRQLSIKERISYGWAHKIIQTLINQSVVTRKNNYVSVSDVNKLLNAVAWERPFESLKAGDIRIDYGNSFMAAQDISSALKHQGIKFAFTGYTAGGLYTGHGYRSDSVYLYLKRDDIERFKKEFRADRKEGVIVHIYLPDRNVFNDVREQEKITVVSPSQALLDLAGLGYSAMDMTKAMVDSYASL